MDTFRLFSDMAQGTKSIILQLSVYQFKEDESYITYCPSLDLSSYGTTENHAQKSFEEILEITLKYMIDKNTLIEDFKKHGWQIKSLKQNKIKSPSVKQMISNNKVLRDILDNKEYRKYNQQLELPEFSYA